MPGPKNNTKLTGDTHLPDVESEFDTEEAQDGAAQGAATNDRKIKDRDASTSDGDRATRESGNEGSH